MNLLFILGFYLGVPPPAFQAGGNPEGDGTFNYRIRESEKENSSIWYIPVLRIVQKDTEDNVNLFKLIQDFFKPYEIDVNIKKLTAPDGYKKVQLKIDSQKSIKNLSNLLKNYEEYYFVKKDQLEMMNKTSILLGKTKF